MRQGECMSTNPWIKVDETVSTLEIDQAIEDLKRARERYDGAALLKSKAIELVDECEAKLLDLLKRAGKNKYHSDLGTVNIVNRFSVKTPKELSKKAEFFGWIEQTYGIETLKGMLSIHSQTLNSFINEVKEKNPLTDIPGLGAPTHEEIIRFTSKK